MFLLLEGANGLALMKVEDEIDPAKIGSLGQARKFVKMEAFHRFEDMKQAVDVYGDMFNGSVEAVPDTLKQFLQEEMLDTKKKAERLAVADQKLGTLLHDALGISCVYSRNIIELIRKIKAYQEELTGIKSGDERAMQVGLAHSLSRYVLRFNSDALDTMVVQAISLLDDIDKEINLYAMRLKEWYGWHFPELTNLVPNNRTYAEAIQIIQTRDSLRKGDNFKNVMAQLTELTDEATAAQIAERASTSFGTDITADDLATILALANEVIRSSDERANLQAYIRTRMRTIAPSLTALVGETVGARLVAHAGSVMTLSRYPASTVQIIGAEKAYFRAVRAGGGKRTLTPGDKNGKSRQPRTPKYGHIFKCPLVNSAPGKLKGKAARIVSARAVLTARHDAQYVRALCARDANAIETIPDDENCQKVSDMCITYVNRRLREMNGGKHYIRGPDAAAQQKPYNRHADTIRSERPSKMVSAKNDVALKGEEPREEPTPDRLAGQRRPAPGASSPATSPVRSPQPVQVSKSPKKQEEEPIEVPKAPEEKKKQEKKEKSKSKSKKEDGTEEPPRKRRTDGSAVESESDRKARHAQKKEERRLAKEAAKREKEAAKAAKAAAKAEKKARKEKQSKKHGGDSEGHHHDKKKKKSQ